MENVQSAPVAPCLRHCWLRTDLAREGGEYRLYHFTKLTMPANLELKVRTVSPLRFSLVLKKIAVYGGLLRQTDTYFNVSKGRLKLREFSTGGAELIYYLRNEGEGNRWSDYQIVPISDAKKLREVLDSLLGTMVVVKKERRVYYYKRTARIHLDKVRGLGNFIELESVAIGGRRKARRVYEELIDILRLGEAESIRKSYSDLILMKRKGSGHTK